jgi:hypothetical protein
MTDDMGRTHARAIIGALAVVQDILDEFDVGIVDIWSCRIISILLLKKTRAAAMPPHEKGITSTVSDWRSADSWPALPFYVELTDLDNRAYG